MGYGDPNLLGESDTAPLAAVLETNPQTVLEFGQQLAEVQQCLGVAGLRHVEPFGEVYLTMTGSVRSTLSGSEVPFDDPERLESLTCTFGRYFFDALRGYIDVEGGRVPPVWGYLFNQLNSSRLGPELAVHGVIAHIVNDLPQAVLDAGMTPEESKNDYFGVDRNISYASEVLTANHLPGRGLVQRRTAGLGTYWATGLRANAWDNFLRLYQASQSDEPGARAEVVESIEIQALKASYAMGRAGRVGALAVGAAGRLYSVPQWLRRAA